MDEGLDYKTTQIYQQALGIAPPEPWLLERVKTLIGAEAHAALCSEFEAHKRRYARAGQLNRFARHVRDADRGFRSIYDTAKMRAALDNPIAYVNEEPSK